MTAVKLGTVGIAGQAISITPSATIYQNQIQLSSNNSPQWALLEKYRHNYCSRATWGTALNFVYDTGNTNSKTCDFFAIAHARRLNYAGINIDITLARSADNISYTDIETINLTSSSVYDSPSNDDKIEVFSEVVSTNRYWRVSLASSASNPLLSTQFFFGQLFDFDLDPLDARAEPSEVYNSVVSENGTEHFSGTLRKMYRYPITWYGVSDAKFEEFSALLTEIEKTGVLIYTANEDLFDGATLIHCQLIEFKYKRIYTDFNEVTLLLKELE